MEGFNLGHSPEKEQHVLRSLDDGLESQSCMYVVEKSLSL